MRPVSSDYRAAGTAPAPRPSPAPRSLLPLSSVGFVFDSPQQPTLHPAPYLPSLRELRISLRAHLTRLLTPDAAQAHARTERRRTLEAEAHRARLQRALIGVRP